MKSDLHRLEASEPKRKDRPNALAIKEIFVDRETFQWRVSKFNKVESGAHVSLLTRALKDTGSPLDPLLVVPVGSKFFLVDGHHRLDAYRKARWKGRIPVTVFEGTLEEARLKALSGNIRDKLRMSGPEKREAAWTLVKERKLSKAEIVKLGATSEGTVSEMRRVLRRLEVQSIDLEPLSWTEARLCGTERENLNPEDWIERKAQEMVEALLKAKVGQRLSIDPQVTARALQKINPDLPHALVREWWFDDPDLQDELLNEQKEAEDVYGLVYEPEQPEAFLDPF